MYIICKKSTKTGKSYLVLVVNDIYVSFDRLVIERVAMTNGISNIELSELNVDERIQIKIGG